MKKLTFDELADSIRARMDDLGEKDLAKIFNDIFVQPGETVTYDIENVFGDFIKECKEDLIRKHVLDITVTNENRETGVYEIEVGDRDTVKSWDTGTPSFDKAQMDAVAIKDKLEEKGFKVADF